MIWNFTDKSTLTMKKLNEQQLKEYLSKVRDKETLLIWCISDRG